VTTAGRQCLGARVSEPLGVGAFRMDRRFSNVTSGLPGTALKCTVLANYWRTRPALVDQGYRPELHYMRGPGPEVARGPRVCAKRDRASWPHAVGTYNPGEALPRRLLWVPPFVQRSEPRCHAERGGVSFSGSRSASFKSLLRLTHSRRQLLANAVMARAWQRNRVLGCGLRVARRPVSTSHALLRTRPP
jgi:hypothetical protein